MKIFKYLILPFVIIAILIVFFITNVNGKSDNIGKIKEKAESEILYLDSKIVYMLNTLNNIIDSNYYVMVENVNEEQNESSSSETSGFKESNSGSNQGDSANKETESNKENSITKTTHLVQNVMSERGEEIDWVNLEGTMQIIYSSWSVIIIDLYKLNVDSNYIIEFSEKLDEAMQNIQNKNKENSLSSLSQVYDFLPYFLDTFSENNELNTIVKIKSNVLKAYSNVATENWDQVSTEMAYAEESINYLLNIMPENENSIFNINKTYIVFKELQNSINTKNAEIFYLKYKNLISELSIIQSY